MVVTRGPDIKCTAHSTLNTALHTAHYILCYTLYSLLHSPHYTLCYTLYTVLHIPHSFRSELHKHGELVLKLVLETGPKIKGTCFTINLF